MTDINFEQLILDKLNKLDGKQDSIADLVNSVDKNYTELKVSVKALADKFEDNKKYLEERVNRNEIDYKSSSEENKKLDKERDIKIDKLYKWVNRIIGALILMGATIGVVAKFC